MDKVRGAIAQIKVGKSRGTGFLISSSGLVLTALHVVADLKASRAAPGQAPKFIHGTIAIRLGDPRQVSGVGQLPTASAQVEKDCWSVEEDWVVLRCDPVPDAAPLPLVELPDGANPVLWDSWGFSDSDPELGTWYRGNVVPRAGSARLELFSVEAAAGRGGMLSGLSGAPLLVAGEVVGLVQAALLEEDDDGPKRSIEGKLYARRLGSIVERCAAVKFAHAGLTLPFETDILTCLERLAPTALRVVARGLDVDLTVVQDAELPRRILRRFASVPFAKSRDALGSIARASRADAFSLLQLAAVLNLHPRAVESVRRGGARRENVLGAWLRHEWQGSPMLFVMGAHAEELTSWQKRTVDVTLTGSELTAGTVIGFVRSELRRRFPSWAMGGKFEESLGSKEFCLILRVVLAPDDLMRICAEFAKARVLMVTPRLGDEWRLPDWVLVNPDLEQEFERQVAESFDDFGAVDA